MAFLPEEDTESQFKMCVHLRAKDAQDGWTLPGQVQEGCLGGPRLELG